MAFTRLSIASSSSSSSSSPPFSLPVCTGSAPALSDEADDEDAAANVDDTDEDTDEDNKDEGVGIVYFIVDKDLPDRGKIGRTKNTDVKKLKSRYSSFGNPHILCHWSTHIKNDENDLKTFMREAGCMKTNTEMISNVPLAREVFYEFIER